MSGSDYVYNEIIKGERLVVEDLSDASYAYAEELDCYEIRKKGITLERFEDLDDVREFLE